jgi:hypothetical protein
MIDVTNISLDKLNSMTKYPSIPTYHELDPKEGWLLENAIQFPCDEVSEIVFCTEKIDGTNSRVIVMPDGNYFIGSRKELLYYSQDLIWNPALGIVDIVKDTADIIVKNHSGSESAIWIYYFESYGKGIQCKNYSTKANACRLFDIASISVDEFEEMHEWPIEKISSWREDAGQDFCSVGTIRTVSNNFKIERVPDVIQIHVPDMPQTLEETHAFLKNNISLTMSAIDETGKGIPEGLVFRSYNRKTIAKARFKDYEKTQKKKSK